MTATAPACLVLTRDPAFARHLALSLGSEAELRSTARRQEWTRAPAEPTLRLLDLRHPEAEAALAETDAEARACVIAFGVPDSDPFLACRDEGLYAVEPLEAPSEPLRRAARQALLLLRAQEELSLARQQLATLRSEPPPAPDEPELNLAPLRELWRASRHVHDIQKLLDQLVEGVAAAGRIARVGVFARLHNESAYRLWAGRRCLDSAAALAFDPDEPFVRWLERQAHLVCRARLPHVADLRDRRLLQHVLDEAGAEVIVPLLGKRGLLGWIAIGHRATGLPFTPRDLADLTVIGEQVATLLENALLVEELAVQKALAENLLEALPVGIVAASEDGVVRWFNRAAEQILGVAASEAVNRPVERADSRVADVMLRTLRDGIAPAPHTWTDPASQRSVRADAHRLGGAGGGLGTMVLLSDVTRERLLRETREELERHAFWSDLAAAMSHEVRNPLVAISTFAQLLPERYADAEFRQQFFAVVTGEVRRLNAIITQINAFAHPRKPAFHPTEPSALASQACARAAQLAGVEKLEVACALEGRLPAIDADADALADALAHVLVNAHEAVRDRPAPRIALHLRCVGDAGSRSLVFSVSDNGPGIQPDILAKLFSPFCTTKPRGLGLGLPLARRAVVDHGGRIDAAATAQGTTVTVTLPIEEGGQRHAEPADR